MSSGPVYTGGCYPSVVADRPLSDREQEQVREYLRQDKYLSRPAQWITMAAMFVVGGVCTYLTQPWPRRGAGGGYVPGGFSGPFITTLASLATVLIVSRLLRRKHPPRAPHFDAESPAPSAKDIRPRPLDDRGP